ncbi:hypothetical protein ISCGN_028816 [Ixodes scapularis]
MDDNAALANEFELPFSDLTPTEREMLLRTQNSGLALYEGAPDLPQLLGRRLRATPRPTFTQTPADVKVLLKVFWSEMQRTNPDTAVHSSTQDDGAQPNAAHCCIGRQFMQTNVARSTARL